MEDLQHTHPRQSPHGLDPEQFRQLGRQVVDQIADFRQTPATALWLRARPGAA